MERYKNLGGNSGDIAFEIGLDYIRVQFSDGSLYLYNNEITGSQNINHMKGLASRGYGLNSFINKAVRKAYARKER